ncbi:MAG: hypothetical protein GY725_15250 [bacterium]|nr:hypothetical protein [bacterium]
MPDEFDKEVELKRLENERLKLRLGFGRFMFGTVVLGILTATLNWQIQRARLQFEVVSTESAFIAKFIDRALAKDLEQRRDFAEYFVRLTPNPESKERWQDYLDFAKGLVEDAVKKEAELEQSARRLSQVAEQAVDAEYERNSALALIAASERKLNDKGLAAADKQRFLDEAQRARKTAEEAQKSTETLQSSLDEARRELESKRRELATLRSNSLQALPTIEEADSTDPIVSETNLPASGWSYVGTWRDDTMIDRVFDADHVPKAGERIEATTDVFQRSRPPRFDLFRGWLKGDRLSVVEQGELFEVEEVSRIPAKGGGWRIWVRGKVVGA